ncbi:tetratricopeptide repeat protein [Teredinibacter sp. KSP-S5-2]|uniref:tetratricopeptide repeat protein n=1 Tax=Teredinibacter sp. KSP-S5-2 TaxID=3034506 RepID=UPI0029346DF0|nr:hypothetical protein [Teredinibacter sp. KSP-S5-2]WNO11354.1 hypothetical protein P5V12_09235 [Teredinibacter sp. KSP-S5-2]
MLDAEELLHLAMKNIQENKSTEALDLLNKCVQIEPNNALAIYLIAAQHAEIGMYDRAQAGMEKALDLDPSLEMASLQLGLLYGHKEELDKAIATWTSLIEKTSSQYIKTFCLGLTAICEDKIERGLELLEQGKKENQDNPALNVSIQNIIDSLGSDESATEQPIESDSTFLGAYRDKSV